MAIAVPPIDPNHKPRTSIAKLPSTAPIESIFEILSRDGGVILTDLATPDQLAAIDADVEAHKQATKSTEDSALALIPKETLAIPGLVGKSPTVAALCEQPVFEALRNNILREEFNIIREDTAESHAIDPLLSISITLHIGYGAPRQKLPRDDNVHGIRHGGEFELKKASQFGVLIAGTRTTRENGATMFIPGSHRWDDERRPRTDEVCFAVHGLFFVRGTMRTEENQFLAIPNSRGLGMSEKMLSLLGYKKPSTALGIVDNEDVAADFEGVLERACH